MLLNKSRNLMVTGRVRLADSFLKRFMGLMFSRKKDFNYALVFPLGKESRERAAIHMLFVFFAIDVAFLDSGKKVVDVVKGLKPFTFIYVPKKAASYVVELPPGKANGISEGDVLTWDLQPVG